jgi:hypothetical protein
VSDAGYDLDDVLNPPDVAREAEREALRSEAIQQTVDAHHLLHSDPTHWTRYPYDSIARLVGPIAPGEYHLLLALTGNGKTTWLLNVLNEWTVTPTRTYGLFFEQPPTIMRLMLAGLALGYDPRLVARLEWAQLPEGAKAAVDTHLLWQGADEMTARVYFDGNTQVGPHELDRTMARAARNGYTVFVVDHFDRLDARSYSDTKKLAEGLKEGAKNYQLAVLCANQVSRVKVTGTIWRTVTPPGVDDCKGGQVVAENADCILSLYRPLVEGFTKADRALVAAQLSPVEDFINPLAMGVKVVKSRWTSHAGKTVQLAYHAARLRDPETDARFTQETRYGV